jgi:glycosyltransferase involved in cell wall biosynthesis
MDASVLIPTRGRGDKLRRCLSALARQEGSPRFEVILGFDGPDPDGARAASAAWSAAGADPADLRIIEYSRRGLIGVRNAMIAEARGRALISINDDVTPCPAFVTTHAREQARRIDAGAPALLVGHSPYAVPAHDTLLNRVVRSTPMVFFYDVMNTPDGLADPDRDWGFRHCFGLNFSAPMDLVRRVGGFRRVDCPYGYEDIELAFRLCTTFSTPVLYRPAALAEHDHAYSSADILDREVALGRAAWCFALESPDFARAVFGRDIASADELDYSRAFVDRERAGAERLRDGFARLDDLPPDAVGEGRHARDLLLLIYQQHLLLKRWCWRTGLLEAAGTPVAAGDLSW